MSNGTCAARLAPMLYEDEDKEAAAARASPVTKAQRSASARAKGATAKPPTASRSTASRACIADLATLCLNTVVAANAPGPRRWASVRGPDEVHNILAGSHRDQRVVLNTLRYLSNRLQISLVCFGVMAAREAISGDVQLARRFEEFSINRWAANEQFETLVSSILRNTPLRKPTVLTPKPLVDSQVTEGITANIFHMINGLAADAAQSGQERITDEGIESWRPLSDRGAAFA